MGLRAFAAAMLIVTPAMAGLPSLPAAEQRDMVEQLGKLLETHQNVEVVALADKVLAKIEPDLAKETRTIFSSQTPESLLLNLVGATTGKHDAVDVGPAYGKALFAKGYALTELGRADEGGRFLDRAVAVSPVTPQFLCEDGYWHAQHHDTNVALDLYKRCEGAAAFAPADLQAHWKAAGLRGQGFALIDLGKLDDAEKSYKASLKIEPNNPNALSDLKYIAQQRH